MHLGFTEYSCHWLIHYLYIMYNFIYIYNTVWQEDCWKIKWKRCGWWPNL